LTCALHLCDYSSRVTLRKRIGLPAAIAAALVTAEAAVRLLRPKGGIEPAEVPESRFFSAAELRRAHDFAGPQRLLALGEAALEGGLLVLLVVRPPRRLWRRRQRRLRGHPLAAAALVGAGIALVLRLGALPLDVLARRRRLAVGLATQGWGGWAIDNAKSTAIGTTLAAVGGTLFLGVVRRSPRRWWLWGAASIVATEVVFVWLAPVLLAPLFNRFERLPAGPIRSELVALARKAGIEVGDVLVMDASRRTSGANAYVSGLGRTKRIVLFDTLLEQFTPGQIRVVVAHELAHVKSRDVARALLWAALVAPSAMYAVKQLTARFEARAGAVPGAPDSLPSLALALALVGFAAGIVFNRLSRGVEAHADAYALELTSEADEFVQMQRRLTITNVAEPDPPRALVALFGTHPAPIDRIGAAIAFGESWEAEAIRARR
jgi:STE24 endopeptidase